MAAEMAENEPGEMARRLRRLEDIEAIKQLKSRYIEACDGGWEGRASHRVETMLALFTEDAVWDGGVYGKREGREALRGYYSETPVPPFAYHVLTSPMIEVDGDHATGNWHLTIAVTMADQSSMLVGGVFNDEYARTAEGWRIKYTRFSLALHAPCTGAWALPDGGGI